MSDEREGRADTDELKRETNAPAPVLVSGRMARLAYPRRHPP